MHDARMLRRSPLHTRMETSPSMFPNDSHILGDLAYPLMPNLLVAYKNNGRLSRQERVFNTRLSAARSAIERAFALLKSRFRRLKYLDMTNTVHIPEVIIACCILHNICLRNGDLVDIDDDVNDDSMDAMDTGSNEAPVQQRQAAVMKRLQIARFLQS